MTRRPRVLDLYCGAGGASAGYVAAGFDVVGVDIVPQDEYPFDFVHGDALTFPLDGFDFVHASPPCKAHSTVTRAHLKAKRSALAFDFEAGVVAVEQRAKHESQVEAIRARLTAHGGLWVIENVVGAPLINPVMLCGAMFKLGVIRHRLFEFSWPVEQPEHVEHKGSIVTGEYVTVTGNSNGVPSWTYKQREKLGLPRYFPGEGSLARRREAMGIDWMSNATLVQAIPPAFARWVGERALEQLRMRA